MNLRCPNIMTVNGLKRECGSEDIIHARVPGPTCRPVMSEYGICCECWHKAKIEKFQDAYEIHHDADGQPEYDPCEEESHY